MRKNQSRLQTYVHIRTYAADEHNILWASHWTSQQQQVERKTF